MHRKPVNRNASNPAGINDIGFFMYKLIIYVIITFDILKLQGVNMIKVKLSLENPIITGN